MATARTKPRTRLQKRRLTVAEAAEQWQRAKLEIERQKPLVAEAAEVLLSYFEKSGKASYKQVGWQWKGGQRVLDQVKVRAFLGERLREFQKTAARSRSLVLLGQDGDSSTRSEFL